MLTIKQAKDFFRNINLELKHTKTSFPQEQINKIVSFAKEYSDKLDLAHDFKHITLVHNTGLLLQKKVDSKLGKEDQQQLTDLVVLSTLLHDCCADKYPATEKELHPTKCADLGYKKLRELGFDEDIAQVVKTLIRCHSTTGYDNYYEKISTQGRYKKEIIQLAANILYDADKLQTIGLFGVIRAIVARHTSENAKFEELQMFDEKQQKKLKLKESSSLKEVFGHLKKNDVTNLSKLLYTIKTILENL